MEAYERQLPTTTALRLCHRFGDGPLSQLPQEILDQVVSEVHQGEKAEIKPNWERTYACYRGSCTPTQHLDPRRIEELWHEMDMEGDLPVEITRDPDTYSVEEKTDMVADIINSNFYDFDQDIWETHDDRQDAWVTLLCSCKRPTNSKVVPDFARLNKVRAIVLPNGTRSQYA
jgi:hypothetical protein